MYCIGCGLDNIEGSARCIRCGQDLVTLRTDIYTKPAIGSSSVVLWNPDVAALLSMPFSAVFGAIIHALNWRRLGQPRRALIAWIWAASILLGLIAVVIISTLSRLSEGAVDSYFRIAHGLALVLWYFGTARSQGKYIANKIHNEYRRESWTIPLCLAIILFSSLYIVTGKLN